MDLSLKSLKTFTIKLSLLGNKSARKDNAPDSTKDSDQETLAVWQKKNCCHQMKKSQRQQPEKAYSLI